MTQNTQMQYGAAVESIKNDIHDNEREAMLRQADSAIDWYESRGTAADNVSLDKLKQLRAALADNEDKTALRHALDVYSRDMHPTADDIVGGSMRQIVYSLTGRGAYTFKAE